MQKTVLNEELLLEIDKYINEAIKSLTEMEQVDDRSFVWDLAKEKIDKSTEKLYSSQQAEEYLRRFLDKIEDLPKSFKVKLSKYVLTSLIGLTSFSSLNDIINSEAPEIKDELTEFSPIALSNNIFNLNKVNVEKQKQIAERIPTKVSNALVNLLKHEEGSITEKGQPVLKAYNIGDGMVTVGWGHATKTRESKLRKGDYITRKQAEEFLMSDIEWAQDRLNNIIQNWKEQGIKPKITQGMYDAMVSLIYNMGIGNFTGKIGGQFLEYVKNGDLKNAKKEILTMSSNLYKKYPGIKNRREKEANLFVADIENAENEKSNTISETYKSRLKKLAGIL
jgi:lysozyme